MERSQQISYGVLVMLSILWLLPLYIGFNSALKTNEEFATSTFWDLPKSPVSSFLNNFLDVWFARGVRFFFFNSLLYSAVCSVVSVFIASLAAFSISRYRFGGRTALFYLLMSGMFLPFQSYILPLLDAWVRLRLFDTFLGLSIVYVAISIPFPTFLLANYYATIPGEIQEAAVVDGASIYRIYVRIFAPLSLPVIATAIIIQFVGIWNELFFGLTLTQSLFTRPLTTSVGLLYGATSALYATIATMLVVAALPPLVIFLVLRRQVVRGMLLGSVKR